MRGLSVINPHGIPLGALLLGVILVAGMGRPVTAMPIERVVSPGGIEAWLIEDHQAPVLAVEFQFVGPTRAGDPPDLEGRAMMAAALMGEGAGPYESQDFHRRLEDRAIQLSFEARQDSLAGGLKTLTVHRAEALRLTSLALTQARFDDEAVDRIRQAALASLRHQRGNPMTAASRLFYRTVFPDHGYGRDGDGTAESLARITVTDMRALLARRLVREQMLVAVCGDIRAAELAPLLDELFGGLPAAGAGGAGTGPGGVAGAEPESAVPDIRAAGGGETLVLQRTMPQTILLLGEQGLKRDDPAWYTLQVLNHILGGGSFSSRLVEEVREKRGLAYAVATHAVPLDHGALIVASASTANARAGEALALIRDEWRRIGAEGVTEQEVDDARTYLKGSFPLQFSSTAAIAELLLQIRRYNLGIDYLERRNAYLDAVTVTGVRELARRLLDPDRLTVVAVGQPVGITATRVVADEGR